MQSAVASHRIAGDPPGLVRLLAHPLRWLLLRELDHVATANTVEGRPVPLLAPPSLRVGLRRLIEPVLPNLPIISLAELPPYVRLSSIATWEIA